jgi:hypothetical protein
MVKYKNSNSIAIFEGNRIPDNKVLIVANIPPLDDYYRT